MLKFKRNQGDLNERPAGAGLKAPSPLLRLALDLGPLMIFFVSYRFSGIMGATAVLIVATLLSIAISYALEGKVSPMPVITGVAVTIFGGLTLYLQDETFIKIKPTLVYLLFAAVILSGRYFNKSIRWQNTHFRKFSLQYIMGGALQLTEEGWHKLSLRWGVFFLFLAVLNEVVWRNFSTDFWVNFKAFGMFGLTVLFTCAQLPLLKRYMIHEEP